MSYITFVWKGQEYKIHAALSDALHNIIYNLQKDWDFVILITGDRSVRTGKSILAMTICAYIAYCLNKLGINNDYNINNIFFDSKESINFALNSPNNTIVHYDEGREAFGVSKVFTSTQKDILDYFAECGQQNNIFVLVLPDFFGLIEEMAVARSELLLNVYRYEEQKMVDVFKDGNKLPIIEFKRGRFEFFNRNTKRKLYERAKQLRTKSYGVVKCNFIGDFVNQFPIPKEDYLNKKKEWLKRFIERKNETAINIKDKPFRDEIILRMHNEGCTDQQISIWLLKKFNHELRFNTINGIINEAKRRENAERIICNMENKWDVPVIRRNDEPVLTDNQRWLSDELEEDGLSDGK